MKAILLAVACVVAAAAPASAQVRSVNTQPQRFWYVGGGYDHYGATGTSINGGGLFGGWRISRFLGLEVGGQYGSVSGASLTNLYAQALLVLPLGDRFRGFVSAGGAYATASASASGVTVSISRSGYRAGAGLEYWFSPRWAMRGEYHRQNAGGVADNYGVGLAYRF